MKDETYAFIQDVKDKKTTARSARNKRTHNGKSGRVRFPSDNMTKKELNAMNGEVKSYRLNEPMSWNEFKAMPNDIQYGYIKLLKEKYSATNQAIEKMLGVSNGLLARHMKGIGYTIAHMESGKFDKEGWLAWCNGVPSVAIDEIERSNEESEQEGTEENPAKPIKLIPVYAGKETIGCSIPKSGSAYYEGNIASVMNSVLMILGNSNVRININWEVKEDG